VVAALKALGLWSELRKSSGIIVATYDYSDETGQLLYQVVRTEPKGFFQRRPDGCGGWINKKGERQVLYHLREVLEAPIVFVAEGEKDAETLRSNGFVATTNAGGAKAPWLPQYTGALRGREVILIPDRDRAGRERVARIARDLVGKVERLVILELEGAKDITEWFERGHSECELIAQIEAGEISK
jgi:5S rRNA maturation endonuclease (ribonuclease M5)